MEEQWVETEFLVRKAQAGDRAAFGELAMRFARSVLAAARSRNRDRHEADELVQEVFLHAMRKIGQLREPACFGAWLRRIAVRVAINRGVRRPPLPVAESEVLEAHGKATASPLEDLVRQEGRERVRRAVAELRPIDRDALDAFYLKGRSLAEIAAQFEVPLGTIKRRLHTARRRLEESLGGAEAAAVRPAGDGAGSPMVGDRRAARLNNDGAPVRRTRPVRELALVD